MTGGLSLGEYTALTFADAIRYSLLIASISDLSPAICITQRSCVSSTLTRAQHDEK